MVGLQWKTLVKLQKLRILGYPHFRNPPYIWNHQNNLGTDLDLWDFFCRICDDQNAKQNTDLVLSKKWELPAKAAVLKWKHVF
jgi:hypothetical protein